MKGAVQKAIAFALRRTMRHSDESSGHVTMWDAVQVTGALNAGVVAVIVAAID